MSPARRPFPALPRRIFLGGAACLCALAAALPARAWEAGDGRGGQDPATQTPGGDPLDRLEVSPGSEPAVFAALDRGLAFLAAQQARGTSGALPCSAGENHAPVGVTALAALAWIGGGSSLTRGPYRENLEKAIDYLLDGQVQEGEAKGYFTQTGDQVSRTHGHGLATLALAQAFTISPRGAKGARIEAALELACERILEAQGVDGGWYYSPTASVEQEGSVTVALMWALRGAKDAGIHIPVEPIDKAVAYVRGLQDKSGGFQYSHTRPQTSVALTAAALSTLHATGIYEGKDVRAGYDYIWRELASRDLARERGSADRIAFPFYERFYLAQALYQHKDETQFERWAAPLRLDLLRSQEKDGSWSDERLDPSGAVLRNQYGKSYSTAINCLVLSIPHSTLPIFSR
ncbi:MAG: prenyltransferase/squalene oxidase repeat-containing protein [Planctomycetota bacterium]